MRIGKVIGVVTPGRIHPSLSGGQLKMVAPFTFEDLTSETAEEAAEDGDYSGQAARLLLATKNPKPAGTEVVVYDELSAGLGEWVAFSEGAEAAMPFYPTMKPIDAYAAAILDQLEIDRQYDKQKKVKP